MNSNNMSNKDLYNKQISIIITRFKNRLCEDIEFNNLFSNNNYEIEVNNLCLNIKNIITIVEDKTDESITYLSDELDKLLSNSLLSMKEYNSSISKYKSKINDIKKINAFEINKIDKNIELFIYKLSIMYNLKNNVTTYKILVSILNSLKLELINSYKTILNDKLDNILLNINMYLKDMLNDIEEELNKEKLLSLKKIKDDYNSNNILLVNKYLNNNCILIKETLDIFNKNLLELLSIKSNSNRNEKLKELNNYMIMYNNTLFSKILSIFKESSEILNSDIKEVDNKLKTYNTNILEINKNDYSFEKVLLNYYKNITSNLVKKKEDKIISLIKDTNNRLSNIVKLSVIDVFRDNYNDLTKKVYLNTSITLNLTILLKRLLN